MWYALLFSLLSTLPSSEIPLDGRSNRNRRNERTQHTDKKKRRTYNNSSIYTWHDIRIPIYGNGYDRALSLSISHALVSVVVEAHFKMSSTLIFSNAIVFLLPFLIFTLWLWLWFTSIHRIPMHTARNDVCAQAHEMKRLQHQQQQKRIATGLTEHGFNIRWDSKVKQSINDLFLLFFGRIMKW